MKVAPTSGTPCGRGGLYGRPDPRRSPTKWVWRGGGGGATERVSVPVYGDAKDVQFAPTRKKVEALSGKIVKVSGPLVVATGLKDANMADVVRVAFCWQGIPVYRGIKRRRHLQRSKQRAQTLYAQDPEI